MGCSQFSRNIIITSSISKSRSNDLLLAETYKTMSGTSVLSLQPSLKISQNSMKPCLKVKICKPFSKFILDETQNINSLGKMMSKIRKFWVLLTAFQNAFEKETHAVCINNYSIKDGLNVLFVVLAMKLEGKLFQVSSKQLSFSFPKIVENLPIVATFKELSNFVNLVLKKNIEAKIEGYKKNIENLLLENKKQKISYRFSYGKSALKAAEEFLGSFKAAKNGISEFVRDLNKGKQRILLWANEASFLGIQSASQIVHLIIKKPSNY